MTRKPIIHLIDTSVFLNILNVPGRGQERESVLLQFEEGIKRGDTFFLPFAAIIETGNHISRTSESTRFQHAKVFSDMVKKGLSGDSPWKPLRFPSKKELNGWLNDFPDNAAKKIEFGDHSIIHEWEGLCKLYSAYSVRIWSLDSDLQGYES